MRAYQLEAFENRFRLQKVVRPQVPLTHGQVRVKMHAVSLNYRDLIIKNKLAGREVAGRIPVSDGAGEVVEVAPDTHWQMGDRVAGCFFQSWHDGPFEMRYHQQDLGGTIDGMLAEEVILAGSGLVSIPKHLSYEEAACLPCAALTAWHALVDRWGFHFWLAIRQPDGRPGACDLQ
jgi:NADPH:quinone reductase-like Zn-dependent oxidoreductase